MGKLDLELKGICILRSLAYGLCESDESWGFMFWQISDYTDLWVDEL